MIKGANLYVSGLPKSMTQKELENMFRPCGQIITSRILCDPQSGQSSDNNNCLIIIYHKSAVCFICYKNERHCALFMMALFLV